MSKEKILSNFQCMEKNKYRGKRNSYSKLVFNKIYFIVLYQFKNP